MAIKVTQPTPEVEPNPLFSSEAPKFGDPDPFKRNRGSLKDRTAHLFDDVEDDGVTDQTKWEDEFLGPYEESVPIEAANTEKQEAKKPRYNKTALKQRIFNMELEDKAHERWPEWWLDAACRHSDITKFFPDKGGSSKEAKAVCASCKAAHACLVLAVETNDEGVRAGLAQRPRRQLHKVLVAGGTWDDITAIRDLAVREPSGGTEADVKKHAKPVLERLKPEKPKKSRAA